MNHNKLAVTLFIAGIVFGIEMLAFIALDEITPWQDAMFAQICLCASIFTFIATWTAFVLVMKRIVERDMAALNAVLDCM
jgi:hypothetical protein